MRPAKILVTLDSSDKVLGVLRGNNMLDSCLFVVDEFQCLMGDATFKGSTDMNFLIRLDSEVKRICYLSATPVPDIYLDYIPQFANIPYYKLEWDPDVIVEPTLKERQMRNGETAEKLSVKQIERQKYQQQTKSTSHFSGKTKLRDVGGGSHSEKREWEVGQKGSYDDIDDGNSMKKITLY